MFGSVIVDAIALTLFTNENNPYVNNDKINK